PGPCIHYIWSPWTLHSLYLVSPDPAFTISGLPGPCIHYIWSPWTLHSLYLVSHRCRTPDLCLDSADWPGANHMHFPKKKKTSLAIHTDIYI
ncbi:unnamed protein product, partial [Staurois parvus]